MKDTRKEEASVIFAQIRELAAKCTCEYETGIDIEIQEVLRHTKEVQEFSIAWGKGTYFVTIMLKEFDESNAGRVFDTLFRFVGYRDALLYVREKEDRSIQYVVASLTENGLRFFCQINFA